MQLKIETELIDTKQSAMSLKACTCIRTEILIDTMKSEQYILYHDAARH